METYKLESCIRGYHIYKDIWTSTVGEHLDCIREIDNPEDPYTVAVVKAFENTTIGQLPRKISAAYTLFLRTNGITSYTVTGNRRYSAVFHKEGLNYLVG